MKQITVIHHSADFDGIFCRMIATKFLGPCNLIPWDYKDDKIPFPSEGDVYVLDLSPECFIEVPAKTERLIWIDHHKSAIEKYNPGIAGYRIDGVAACRLAWQWFTNETARKVMSDPAYLPNKEDYVNRGVREPWAVRLAGEYDIWDKRDPDAELFQHGLRSQELSISDWDTLLADLNPWSSLVVRLLNQGRALQFARGKENASIIKEIGFTMEWEGLRFLCCNAARYNSLLFTAGLTPEHDACFGFKWTGKTWSVSLYHAPGKEHHDLSKIAVKHGGGGHRGACGFTINQLPFLP